MLNALVARPVRSEIAMFVEIHGVVVLKRLASLLQHQTFAEIQVVTIDRFTQGHKLNLLFVGRNIPLPHERLQRLGDALR